MREDSLVGGEDEMTELPGRQNVVGSQEFEQDFRHGLEEDLLFTFAFGIHDGLQGVSQDIDLHH